MTTVVADGGSLAVSLEEEAAWIDSYYS